MTQSFRALLDTEISELKILKSLTKGQLLADQPVSQGPSYIFCTKYKHGDINETHVISDNHEDIIGIVRTYSDSIESDKLISLEIKTVEFNVLKSLYIGQDINYIIKGLKDITVYTFDSRTGLSTVVLSTPTFNIILTHDQHIVTKVVLNRVCD
jgi:hypothetical protein